MTATVIVGTVEHYEAVAYATDYGYGVICICSAHCDGDTPEQARKMLGAHIAAEAIKQQPYGDPNFYSRDDDETGEHTPPPVPDWIELIPLGRAARGGAR